MQALGGFTSLTTPGSIKLLPFRWSQGDGWKETALNDGDTRTERHATPQYQLEEDRMLAEHNNPEVCAVCEASA